MRQFFFLGQETKIGSNNGLDGRNALILTVNILKLFSFVATEYPGESVVRVDNLFIIFCALNHLCIPFLRHVCNSVLSIVVKMLWYIISIFLFSPVK